MFELFEARALLISFRDLQSFVTSDNVIRRFLFSLRSNPLDIAFSSNKKKK